MIEFLILLAFLLFGHALADYPLQGDFLAKAKSRHTAIPGVPWQWALGMHSIIHAGMVLLITGSLGLALLEFLAHSAIDYAKTENFIDFNTDQILHIACKLVWALFVIAIGG